MSRLYFLLMAFLFSCSLNYKEVELADKLGEDIPNSVLQTVVYSEVKNGHLSVQIKAAEILGYKDTNIGIIQEAELIEYDAEGKIISEGKTGHMTYNFNTEDAMLENGINFYSNREKIGIEGEDLSWINESKNLTSRPENLIQLHQEDGSTLAGYNFSANLRRKEIYFKNGVEGTYADEKK